MKKMFMVKFKKSNVDIFAGGGGGGGFAFFVITYLWQKNPPREITP